MSGKINLETLQGKNMENIPAILELRRSVTLLLGKPILFAPIFFGTILVEILDMARYYANIPDIFGWWWLEDLSYFSAGEIVTSVVYMTILSAIAAFFALVSLNMAKNTLSNEEANIGKSVRYVLSKLPTFVIAFIVGQTLLYTYVLGPIGLLIIIIPFIESGNIVNMFSKAVKFFFNKPIDVIILVAIAFIARVILSQFPVAFVWSLRAFPDLVVGVAIIYLYISNKPQQPISKVQ